MLVFAESLDDAISGAIIVATLIGSCMTTWWFVPAISRRHFWRVLIWSHGIGFLLVAIVYFIRFALVGSTLEVFQTKIDCFIFAPLLSLVIGTLLITRLKDERKQDNKEN